MAGRAHFWAVAAVFLAVSGSRALAAGPAVAASIAPIHSLVASVMAPRKPTLLLPPAQSEHATSLLPASATALARARVVYRVARGFELALDRPIDTLSRPGAVIELARAPGIKLLPNRVFDEESAPPLMRSKDLYMWANLHVWLDPTHAKAMVNRITSTLSASDPSNARLYAANGADLGIRLNALDHRMADALAPVSKVPFIVFHDAYAYLEARYGLRQVGIVEVIPDEAPSARHIVALRETIRKTGAACIFAEPQFEPKILATITEGFDIKTGTLDPVGADLEPGPDLYFNLMQQLTKSLKSCLRP